MPKGFKRANAQKHKFIMKQKHSKRNYLKECVNNSMDDNDIIIYNKDVKSVKYMYLTNQDINIKKSEQISVNYERDSKFNNLIF